MHIEHTIRSGASGLRVGLVVSRYHREITGAMRDAAIRRFVDAGGREEDVCLVESPGAFELIALCAACARRSDLDAVVAIGCIITGETSHDQYLAEAVSNGIAHTIVQTGVPISFGVLTCQTLEQARQRAGGAKGNKGEEAMLAAIESVIALREIQQTSTLPQTTGVRR